MVRVFESLIDLFYHTGPIGRSPYCDRVSSSSPMQDAHNCGTWRQIQDLHMPTLTSWQSLSGMTVFLLFLFSSPVFAQDQSIILPNKTLTPGQVRSINVDEICQPGYSKSVRRTSRKLKRSIYKRYHIKNYRKRYKIDHLIPLSIGGSDNAPNLWPSPLFPQPINGHDKDRLEFKLYRKVCHAGYDVQQAQKEIQNNWLDAYDKHCSEPDSCPSFITYMRSIDRIVR